MAVLMDNSKLKKNIVLICIIKCLSSFSFSVIFGSLALYLNLKLQVSEQQGAQWVALFFAFNFSLPLIGGWLGNYLINFKLLFKLSLIAQALGYFCFSQAHSLPMLGLALSFILVSSMIKSVSIVEFISCTMENHPQYLRIAMQLNYGAMNFGFIFGLILSGLFGYWHRYNTLFLLLILGPIISFVLTSVFLTYEGTPRKPTKHPIIIFLLLALFLMGIINITLHYSLVARNLLLLLFIVGVIISIVYGSFSATTAQRKSILVFVIYMLVSIFFWMVFMLTPIVVMYLIKDHVNLLWHGWHLQPQWLDIDPYVIALGTPLLAYLMNHARARWQWEPPTYLLFAIALGSVALGTLTLGSALSSFTVKFSFLIIVFYTACIALGELFLAPEGYTLPARLAPKKMRGVFTGVWVSNMGIASLCASLIASQIFNLQQRNNIQHYQHTYYWLTGVALLLAILLLGVGFTVSKRSDR